MTLTEIIGAGAEVDAAIWMGIRIGEDEAELGPRIEIGAVPYAVVSWRSSSSVSGP